MKKSDLQGTGWAGYGYEKVTHCNPDVSVSLELTDASVGVKEGKEFLCEQRLVSNSGIEDARGKGLVGNIGERNGESSPVKSRKTLFSVPAKTSDPLQFSRPHKSEGKFVVRPPAEAVEEGIDMWKGCLVGQILDN